MATQSNPQVDAVIEKYNTAKTEMSDLRKAHLAKKAEVRTLRSTLETLVEFGVVDESVLGDTDEDKAEAADSE